MKLGSFAGGLSEGLRTGYKLGLEAEELEEKKRKRRMEERLDELRLRIGEVGLQNIENERQYLQELRGVAERHMTQEVPDVGPEGETYGMKRVPKAFDPYALSKEMLGVAAKYGRLGPQQIIEAEKGLEALKGTRVFDAYTAMQAGDNQRAAEILKGVGVSIDPTTLMGYKEKGPFGFEYDVFVARTPDGGHFKLNPKDLVNNVAFRGLLGLQQAGAQLDVERAKVRVAEDKARGDQTFDEARARYYHEMARRLALTPIPQPKSDDKDLTRREVFDRLNQVAGIWVPDVDGKMRKMPGIFNTADYMKLYDQLVKSGKTQYEAMAEVAEKMEKHQRSLIGTVRGMMEELKKVPESRRSAYLATMIEDAQRRGVKKEDILRTIEYLESGMGRLFNVNVLPVSPIGLEAASEQLASSGGGASQFALEMGWGYPEEYDPAWGKGRWARTGRNDPIMIRRD